MRDKKKKNRKKMRKRVMKGRIPNGGYSENGCVSVTDTPVKTDEGNHDYS